LGSKALNDWAFQGLTSSPGPLEGRPHDRASRSRSPSRAGRGRASTRSSSRTTARAGRARRPPRAPRATAAGADDGGAPHPLAAPDVARAARRPASAEHNVFSSCPPLLVAWPLVARAGDLAPHLVRWTDAELVKSGPTRDGRPGIKYGGRPGDVDELSDREDEQDEE